MDIRTVVFRGTYQNPVLAFCARERLSRGSGLADDTTSITDSHAS